ncbi:LysR family transcriptional regulator [Marinomonas sp. 2405UD68-3]|uniref:LysR family transcriptional regulator n=1 Tax=Marinomonas sp. 2405UD68-3 TaxID=3391835 RepID=UPI0039C981F6
MLSSHHLNTFKTLVESLSFTQAAKELGLTQPAVTQHIQKLEKELGKVLVIRRAKSLEMTPAGEMLYQYTIKLADQYQAFLENWYQKETSVQGEGAA